MRDGFGCCFGVGLLMVAGAAFGQTAAGNPGQAAAGKLAFVSATVKPSAPVTIDSAHAASAQFEADVKAGKVKLQPGVMVNTTHPRMGAHVDASQAEYNFLPLIDLIAIAYNVKVNQVSGPDWINGQRFDIVAKMPGGAFIADASNMLQALLEDRFKLAVHRETKDQQVLALVVAKGGPNLADSPASVQPIDVNATGNFGQQYGVENIVTPDGPIRFSFINGHSEGTTLQSNKITMEGFADLLTRLLRGGSGIGGNRLDSSDYGGDWRAVVDRTGLKGEYQVTVHSSKAMPMAESLVHDPFQSTVGGPLDPLVFESVQKLGLKLEVSRGKVEMLVVDHAEKMPTAN
jgi:uncharacterized protein (TIGR03435 family)